MMRAGTSAVSRKQSRWLACSLKIILKPDTGIHVSYRERIYCVAIDPCYMCICRCEQSCVVRYIATADANNRYEYR